MFGRKKMYKKGLADAMQAYEAHGRKQEAALAHMREEVRKGNLKLEAAISDLGEDLNGIYDHLTSREKAALYHLSTPMDIKDLEDEEKRLLLAVLYQLSFDEGDGVTDSQRSYIRSVQKYLEITNPQTEAELSAVGDIDSLETQKAFLQVALEFLYLQDGDELSDGQEEFLGCFSVNRKQAALIEERVSRLFNAVGGTGIAEKYGYVPEEEPEPEAKQSGSESTGKSAQFVPVSEELADEIAKRCFSGSDLLYCFETENYLLVGGRRKFSEYVYRVSKRTNEWIELEVSAFYFLSLSHEERSNYEDFSSIAVSDVIYSSGDSDGISAFDLNSLKKSEQITNIYCHSISICGSKMAYIKGSCSDSSVCLYDFDSGKHRVIAASVDNAGVVYATPDGVFFSYTPPNEYMRSILSFYDYKDHKKKDVFDVERELMFDLAGIQRILFVGNEKIYTLCWESDDSDNYLKPYRHPARICIIPYKIQNNPVSISLCDFDNKDLGFMHDMNPQESIFRYPDMLLYVAKSGALKCLEYSSGKTIELTSNALSLNYGKKHPAHIMRIGKWVYFEADSPDYVNKVSIDTPGEFEVIEKYSDEEREKRMQEIQTVSIEL